MVVGLGIKARHTCSKVKGPLAPEVWFRPLGRDRQEGREPGALPVPHGNAGASLGSPEPPYPVPRTGMILSCLLPHGWWLYISCECRSASEVYTRFCSFSVSLP